MGAFQAIIDQWLADDREAPRKQRHTAVRIHARLAEEYDANLRVPETWSKAMQSVRQPDEQRRAADGRLKALLPDRVGSPGIEVVAPMAVGIPRGKKPSLCV